MSTHSRQTLLAYTLMIAFMALSTAALVAGAASSGIDLAVGSGAEEVVVRMAFDMPPAD